MWDNLSLSIVTRSLEYPKFGVIMSSPQKIKFYAKLRFSKFLHFGHIFLQSFYINFCGYSDSKHESGSNDLSDLGT